MTLPGEFIKSNICRQKRATDTYTKYKIVIKLKVYLKRRSRPCPPNTMEETNRNSMKLDIEAVRLSDDREQPKETYKPIPEYPANLDKLGGQYFSLMNCQK